jgi:hypothetical protein
MEQNKDVNLKGIKATAELTDPLNRQKRQNE